MEWEWRATMRPALKAGDKLYFLSHQKYRASEEVTVLKAGRKWATLDNDTRIDLEDWVADGGDYSSPGRCYLSKQEYDDECELLDKWEALVEKLDRRSPPEGMTPAKIAQITEVVFGKGN
jgi:hypothetical protein